MPVGQDSLDWHKIFTAAKTGGVKNYFVEMNLEMLKASVPLIDRVECPIYTECSAGSDFSASLE